MSRKQSRNNLIDILSNNDNKNEISEIALDILVPFPSHPFKLYSGTRLEDMVESVRNSGILHPILVRSKGDKYEILSGHNRVNAAKLAGLITVPSIIMENLTDDEARFIVTETNLRQRSFDDLSYREKSSVICMHIEAVRKSGKYDRAVKELDAYIESNSENHFRTRDEVGKDYGLSPRTVSYLASLQKLPDIFLEALDNKHLSFVCACRLATVSKDGLQTIERVFLSLPEPRSISSKQVAKLHELDADGNLTETAAADTLKNGCNEKNEKNEKRKSFAVSPKIISQFFKPEDDEKEIQKIITKALRAYFEKKR